MDVSYSKDTYHTYMVMRGNGDGLAEEEIMLSNQDSQVFLPFHIRQLDGNKDYYYDITGKIDFRSLIEKKQADRQVITSVIQFLENVCHVADEFLLDIDRIVLDTACLYVDMDEKQLSAAYLPGWEGDFMEAVKQLTAFLLEHTDHTDQEGVLLVYDFYQMVRREDFVPNLLGRLTERDLEVKKPGIFNDQGAAENLEMSMDWEAENSFEGVDEQPTSYQGAEQVEKGKEDRKGERLHGRWIYAGMASMGILIILLHITGMTAYILLRMGLAVNDRQVTIGILLGLLLIVLLLKLLPCQKKVPEKNDSEDEIWEKSVFNQGGVYSFTDETCVEDSLMDENNTVLLSDAVPVVRLISMNKNIAPDLVLTCFPCVVGSSRTEAQSVIQAIGVSRKHGMFEMEQGDIYLTDLNSTNGIRVNGERLRREERRRLLVEDMIEFADVRYMYCGKGNAEN